MIVYLVLLLAILSRLLPPMLHFTAMNFTAVGGSLLFFGAKRNPWAGAIAVAAMMGTDFFLTTYVYHYPFHLRGYLITWAWYAAVLLIGEQPAGASFGAAGSGRRTGLGDVVLHRG